MIEYIQIGIFQANDEFGFARLIFMKCMMAISKKISAERTNFHGLLHDMFYFNPFTIQAVRNSKTVRTIQK